jgi:hypothetical protein
MDDDSSDSYDRPVRIFAFHCDGEGFADEAEEREKNDRGWTSVNFHPEPAFAATKLSVASLCNGVPPLPVSASICTSTVASPWSPFMRALVRLKCMRMESVWAMNDVICCLKSWLFSILLRLKADKNLPAERFTNASFILFNKAEASCAENAFWPCACARAATGSKPKSSQHTTVARSARSVLIGRLLATLTAFRPIKNHPHGEVGSEISKPVHFTGGSKENITG